MNLCWHKFGKWSEVIASVGGCSSHQVRCCEKCGTIKQRVASSAWTAYLHPHAVNNAVKDLLEQKNGMRVDSLCMDSVPTLLHPHAVKDAIKGISWSKRNEI